MNLAFATKSELLKHWADSHVPVAALNIEVNNQNTNIYFKYFLLSKSLTEKEILDASGRNRKNEEAFMKEEKARKKKEDEKQMKKNEIKKLYCPLENCDFGNK